jgi:hypothetical protein
MSEKHPHASENPPFKDEKPSGGRADQLLGGRGQESNSRRTITEEHKGQNQWLQEK